jgi:hypothetical protein
VLHCCEAQLKTILPFEITGSDGSSPGHTRTDLAAISVRNAVTSSKTHRDSRNIIAYMLRQPLPWIRGLQHGKKRCSASMFPTGLRHQ